MTTTNNELARIIVQAANDLPFLPAKNDPQVLNIAKSRKSYLEAQAMSARRIIERNRMALCIHQLVAFRHTERRI